MYKKSGKRTYKAKAKGRKGYARKILTGVSRGLFGGSLRSTQRYFSPTFEYPFRRFGYECKLINSATGAPTLYSDAAQTWAAVSNPLSDNASGIDAGVPLQFGMTFKASLTNLLNPAEFTNLFNEYQIVGMDVEVQLNMGPSYNSMAPGITAGGQMPQIWRRYDPNDAGIPTSFIDVAQSQDCTLWNFANGDSVTYKGVPTPATPMYAGGAGVVAGYGFLQNVRKLWLDCTAPSDSIEHYHSKCWVRNWPGAATTGCSLRLQPIFYVVFRRPR